METTNNTYFSDWIRNIYLPNLLIYSTPHSEKIIRKNNVSPAEFIRGFTNFTGTNISFSFSDKFSVNLKNFRLDTYDSIKFGKKSSNQISEILENVLLSNQPEFNTSIVGTNTKRSIVYSPEKRDQFLKSLTQYNFPWYNEYEKVFIESMFFSELEMYQQPFGYVFICSIHDKLDELKKTKTKPILLQEEIYESKMSSMVLILYDKSEGELNREEIMKNFEAIKAQNPKYFIYFAEVNNAKEDDIPQKDIWSSLIHKIDYYNPLCDNKFTEKGKLISLDERESLKSAFLKFMNEYIKPCLQKMVQDLDEDISSNKKGFANALTSYFKKSDKIEYNTNLNIYKLTSIEKKMYLLSLIQFHFKDFENAAENLKLLYGEIKVSNLKLYYRQNQLTILFVCMNSILSRFFLQVSIKALTLIYLTIIILKIKCSNTV